MPLRTVTQDLEDTTLQSVAGLLAKLEYLGGLLRDGSYSHWGLERTHGTTGAHQALAEAHQKILSRVLRTPLEQLLHEVEAPRGLTPSAYLEQLLQNARALLPPRRSTASLRHLDAALFALSRLSQARSRA